jgi:hypothetical protein
MAGYTIRNRRLTDEEFFRIRREEVLPQWETGAQLENLEECVAAAYELSVGLGRNYALKLYEGTLFFVSHDRKLINSVADRIITIEDCRLNTFEGSYEELMEFRKRAASVMVFDKQKQKLLLDTRISEVLSRLSIPGKGDDIAALDLEYKKLLQELRQLETGGI